MRELRADCAALDPDSDALHWLAFRLFNCHLARTGRRTYRCAADATPGADGAKCTAKLSPADNGVYTQFVLSVSNMCVFIANADFDRRAAHVMSELARASGAAAAKVRAPRTSRVAISVCHVRSTTPQPLFVRAQNA